MKIRAEIKHSQNKNEIRLDTDGKVHGLDLAPGSPGAGLNASGGELLLLALATCYRGDLYREAAKLEIKVAGVEVEVEGEFGKEGEPACQVTYHARVKAVEDEERIQNLMRVTDRLAEVQNTLRDCVPVTLTQVEPESVK
jgi:uncharacterized OsmC-like protein